MNSWCSPNSARNGPWRPAPAATAPTWRSRAGRAARGGTAQHNEPLKKSETPARRTIEEITEYLGVPSSRRAKTLESFVTISPDSGRQVAGPSVCASDHRGQRSQGQRPCWAPTWQNSAAESHDCGPRHGAPTGFAASGGLKVPVYLDHATQGTRGFVAGANRADAHYLHVSPAAISPPPDGPISATSSPATLSPVRRAVEVRRGIEVGHIFKLGPSIRRSSGPLSSTPRARKSPSSWAASASAWAAPWPRPSSRTTTPNGIVWPVPIAPWEVIVLPLQVKDEETMKAARALEAELAACCVEVLVDDRDERPGVKFKDADLLASRSASPSGHGD